MRDDFEIQRADLSLGVRGAARYYNELMVPGIGGAWRVRHLSWAVAGIWLQQNESCTASASTVANAIEALANKLQWTSIPEGEREQVVGLRGRRAFSRHPDAWRFVDLSQRKFYVQAPHRQQVTRALAPDTGLSFAEGSSRFNGMRLTPAGDELATAMLDEKGAGRGRPALKKNLSDWIKGTFAIEGYEQTLVSLLGPFSPGPAERRIVLGRLRCKAPPASVVGLRDPDRRVRLLRFLEDPKHEVFDTGSLLGWLEDQPGGLTHVHDIQTALAFEDMRNAAVDVIWTMAGLVGKAGNRVLVRACAQNQDVQAALEGFLIASRGYLQRSSQGQNGRLDAQSLAAAAELAHPQAIEALVRRDGRILQLSGDSIWGGPVFRTDAKSGRGSEEIDDEEATSQGPARLFQFVALWRDCHAQG